MARTRSRPSPHLLAALMLHARAVLFYVHGLASLPICSPTSTASLPPPTLLSHPFSLASLPPTLVSLTLLPSPPPPFNSLVPSSFSPHVSLLLYLRLFRPPFCSLISSSPDTLLSPRPLTLPYNIVPPLLNFPMPRPFTHQRS